ncbi:MAG: hypothetical protein EHM43_07790 [Ignavibacteriae bacterium]|nr:MAG: hypothetical protein EHM43_07790 [Ignavibacteriota bacterium]
MSEHTSTSLFLVDAYRRIVPQYLRVAAIVLSAVAVLSFLIPQTYTAETSIMPPESKSGSGGLSSLLQASPINIGLGETAGNKTSMIFKEILTSRTLLEGVVDTLKLTEHPLFAGADRADIVEGLSSAVTIDSKKTGTVTVEAEVSTGWFPFGEKPDQAAHVSADIANACRMVLDRINRDKAISQARQSRRYIERVLNDTKQQIDSLQGIMQKFQMENKVFALDEQMSAIVDNAVTVGTELAKAQLELAMVKQDFQSSSPQVQFMQQKVEALQAQYNSVQTGGLVTSDGFSIPFSEVPALTRTYTNLVRDLKIKEQINAYLETQRMQELIQEAKDIPTVVELDAAIPPRKRTSPKRTAMLFFAWALVTLGYIVWVPLRTVVGRTA